MPIARRNLLAGSAAGVGLSVAGAVPALANSTPPKATGKGRGPGTYAPSPHTPFPPLVDDPDGILALPEGFSYAIVTSAGETTLDTGEPTPSNHDGTAVVAAKRGRYTLIQNHELGAGSALGVPHRDGTVYDPGAVDAGGCTVITTDASGRNLGEFVGISGTSTNCAGGPTPWGTWLTCEETETKAGESWSGNGKSGTYALDHGYVFEVFADGRKLPKPIKAFGRYAHEALAIDPDLRHVYLSEDASGPNGLFYRWEAPRGVRLGAGIADRLAPDAGTLAAMAIVMPDGSILPDVAYLTSTQMGRPFPVTWVPVPDRDAQTTSVRKQFTDGQVTRGKKFEGVYGTDKGVYVVNSYAYSKGSDYPDDAVPHDGMVWFYNYEEQTIQMVTYFPHNDTVWEDVPEPVKYDDLVFDGPDNVTVTPWGSLVLAEDGEGASHVLSSFPNGPTYAIARNMYNNSEFTGPTFSEDGKVLFVNIQTPGFTLAITGPWEKYLG
ncbi:alkaline phosphatase PhoX [Nocardioides cheoyonin]|uniref:alkaline phosphatase PhoX n=1 Tax=Nocardioides cheoyonin TaxID=3156615 RepID=UPI0032B32ED0